MQSLPISGANPLRPRPGSGGTYPWPLFGMQRNTTKPQSGHTINITFPLTKTYFSAPPHPHFGEHFRDPIALKKVIARALLAPCGPMGAQGPPKGPPRPPKGTPRAPQGPPKGHPRPPKGTPRVTQGHPRPPKGTQAWGIPNDPKWVKYVKMIKHDPKTEIRYDFDPKMVPKTIKHRTFRKRAHVEYTS